MNDKKTNKYNYSLTEKQYMGLELLKEWCNDVFYTEWDRKFGSKNYRKIPYCLMINIHSSQTHKIIDWLDGLDEEYHNLFGTYGKKIYFNEDTRLPYEERRKIWNGDGDGWEDYKKKFNRICKEVFHQQKFWYSNEEKIVLNFFKGLCDLLIDDKLFQYSKINMKSYKEELIEN